MRVGELSIAHACSQMSGSGIAIRIPPITVRVHSPVRLFAEQIHALYRDHELVAIAEFADVDVRMLPVRSLRPSVIPKVQFIVDGTTPFDAFACANALPMFEWGLNWVFAQRMHTRLLLHAAVIERNGLALVLPALPGSGKSTLAASLACRGWRFLSDEFALVADGGINVLPFVRPVALKNESIEVIRRFSPDAWIGTSFHGTRKGTVAHFRPTEESVLRGSTSARIAAIVFPDFRVGVPTTIEPLEGAGAFLRLAGNAFNYEVVGERAFRTVASIVRRCGTHVLRYGELESAHSALESVINRVASA